MIGISVCAVCSGGAKRRNESWVWVLERDKLYFLCSIDCLELYKLNPLGYEDRVMPKYMRSMPQIEYKDYWQTQFPEHEYHAN